MSPAGESACLGRSGLGGLWDLAGGQTVLSRLLAMEDMSRLSPDNLSQIMDFL